MSNGPAYRPADPTCKAEYDSLMSAAAARITPELQTAANDLALRLRSRLIDLATWRSDMSSEYLDTTEQCRQLTRIAGSAAHPFLQREFGISTAATSPPNA